LNTDPLKFEADQTRLATQRKVKDITVVKVEVLSDYSYISPATNNARYYHSQFITFERFAVRMSIPATIGLHRKKSSFPT